MRAKQTYKETQAEQQNLLMTAQAEGQADIQSGIDTYNETIEADVQDVNEKVQKQSVAYADGSGQMLDQLRGVQANVRAADNILNRGEAHDEKQEQTQVSQLHSMSKEIGTIHTDQ